MKSWYDRKAHSRRFNPGDRDLQANPIHGCPLQACYSGPVVVEEKVNEVDYVIRTPGCRKDRRLCHINMLKAYHEREATAETEL